MHQSNTQRTLAQFLNASRGESVRSHVQLGLLMKTMLLTMVLACGSDGTVTGPPAPGVDTPPANSDTAVFPSTGASAAASITTRECSSPKSGWIFCDDFESDRLGKYFEYDRANGNFVRNAGSGVGGSWAMRARFEAGQTNAGSLKLAFGKTPSTYFRPVDKGTTNYRELYWRLYLRNQTGWTGGGGDKLSRLQIIASSSWAQAMVAPVWSGSGSTSRNYLVIDPVTGTDASGRLLTTKYNDFANQKYLGAVQGKLPLFDAAHVGKWYCIEARVRLNDPGQSNGVFQMWINGELQASKTNLNWVGRYSTYGLNTLFIENFWNNGSPKRQDRFIDNVVVSTKRIGC
jgi:hypothetical protein